MADVFPVGGLIGIRWREWGGADGPFGAALSGEDPVPGTAGKRQRFERGEMVWAPEQDMLLSAFRLRSDVCLQWSIPHFEHEYFRCNAFFNGQPQGLHENTTIQPVGHVSDLQLWLRMQGFGDYDFHVAAYDDDDHTVRGWTVPVRIRLGADPGLAPPPFPVNHPFSERWHEFHAGNGPFGLPTGASEQFAVPGSTAWRQNFEHGQTVTHFALGSDFMMSAHQVGDVIEVNWGGFTTPFDKFRVVVTKDGALFQETVVEDIGLEWARRGRGSGRFRFEPPFGDATYSFVVKPGIGVIPPGDPLFTATAPVTLRYVQPLPDAPLDPPPLDGSPAQAFASHTVRARAIARHFVATRRMDRGTGVATEDSSIQLIAHLHMLRVDPEFRVPGEPPNKVVAHTLLRTSGQGNGAMGTSYNEGFPIGSRQGDYDMALKGLMVVLHRYRDLLTTEQIDFLLRDLIPARLPGPIDPGFEWYWLLTEKAPETENHLLMMNSSKYLVNEILFERTGDPKYDNTTNGVRAWLLNFMANFARHDFMEFNSRPYQRLSLHVMLNLHEFGDTEIRTAAHIVLDYIMTKFALSSSRGRRVPPLRRMKENANRPGKETDHLIGGNVDQVANLFLTYVGPTVPDGKPWPWFLNGWCFPGVIAGLAAYRPPPAAYIIALTAHEPAQHRFYHGNRPEMTEADERAEGGVELYYKSPSFLLSAGGMFLNSGYGQDELQGYKQVSVAQSTTLIPVRADATFGELIRFDPYPGDRDADGDEQLQRDAVNTGVHLGFACGANLEVPDRWQRLAVASWDGPWLLLDLDSQSLAATHHQPERRLGFYVAVYRTPVADPERLKVNYGTVPHNFGWLYAMEATAMSFETFSERIRRRNSFPAKLDWDAKYKFTTPEEPARVFDFWMRPDQFKHVPRIFMVDNQPVLPGGFTSLPLVDGPFLRSSGHEGLLEIRAPGQDPATPPLVLDHRQNLAPTRADNADTWPAPHIDRARAVIAFARHLTTLTPPRLTDAIDTVRAFTPPVQAAAEYTVFAAELLHSRITRLLTDGRLPQAAAHTPETLTAYDAASAAPGADIMRVARDLNQLAAQLGNHNLTHEAVTAQQTLVDHLTDHAAAAVSADQLLEYHIMLAEARHNLIARLLADRQPEKAATLVSITLASYRQYVALPGADIMRVARDLNQLAAQLGSHNLTHDAVTVQQALVDLLAEHPPAGTEDVDA
ncbi:hypothetical protein ABGB17_09610 [Sphaerisporangium sp. B11E5]|uniref:hypothetical protein n=1 Tax=Sphaerisporangium sp. B11E5 TaxID=3153563 RepID=UPI00325DE92C